MIDVVKMQILIQQFQGGALAAACLTSSLMQLMLLGLLRVAVKQSETLSLSDSILFKPALFPGP